TLHPGGHSWDARAACLDELAKGGWQVGTGVMCGLPGQTLDDLTDDILFFKKKNVDMIGMGPWIPHSETPLAAQAGGSAPCSSTQAGRPVPRWDAAEALRLGLNMIAATRLALRDVNIASTTALQALAPNGRERGLLAGANVIMPNLTPATRRAGYALYDNKPACDENAEDTRAKLEAAVRGVGETIAYDDWGDPPHFEAKKRFGQG
ncbi:MAG: [FeFe] hydrogenase H-cluster radical SAM maturase HydE, partial [Kiritimatiellaeota bacterium]|nr:[FeFe] hydrogenase H-cluster radical SAM maturase HydE [Kiritimatiellota bacterium]